MSKIILKEINHHNFQNVSLEIEKNKLIVITGPSGSGKSTLAMDVIYAEGQRKFIESLPSYARQFIPLPEQASIGSTEGLTPSIVIDQNTASNATRSTVGTVSQIYDFIRILYSLVAQAECLQCRTPISPYTAQTLAEYLCQKEFEKKEISIAVPLNQLIAKKSDRIKAIPHWISLGYRTFIDETNTQLTIRDQKDLESFFPLMTKKEYSLLFYREKFNHEFTFLKKTLEDIFSGVKTVTFTVDTKTTTVSQLYECLTCKIKIDPKPICPKLFSFNLPTGACPDCKGMGENIAISNQFSSIDFFQMGQIKEQSNESTRRNKFYFDTCKTCKGEKLNNFARCLSIGHKNISQFCELEISEYHPSLEMILDIPHPKQTAILKTVQEIKKRLSILQELGLGYLTLNRNSNTLSGGELQRIRLAGQLGSGLSGTTYILDEPSIGLHQSDNTKLIGIMKDLRDLGNTVIVVEHDEETIMAADTVIDIGPAAGIHGGKILFIGNPEALKTQAHSLTGEYLSGKRSLVRKTPRKNPSQFFEIKNATQHNLKNISVKIPLGGVMTAITGISGSGKSTLIFEEFIPQYLATQKDAKHHTVIVDQQPIGKTMRSTIGTYFGFFDEIREIFSGLPESQALGLKKGSFSFNTGDFRCGTCQGKGILSISMEPLPSTTVVCQNCKGMRYQKTILNIRYKNKNIFDVLEMNVEEALSFFEFHKKIKRQLSALMEVGLSYITLNQGSDTFSGGESQRVKLAYELTKKIDHSVYILDEPTTGLHFQDISLLLKIFDTLLEKGSSLIIIEHNLDIIRYADYIIDMGPSGGRHGGKIIAMGSPEEIKKNNNSVTGKYL